MSLTPARVATTGANHPLSGLSPVDGVAIVAGDRVLVKDQTLGKNNGVYHASGQTWARVSDLDRSAEVQAGLLVEVAEGAENADTIFTLTTNNPIVLGTTPLTFVSLEEAILGGEPLARSVEFTINGDPEDYTRNVEIQFDQPGARFFQMWMADNPDGVGVDQFSSFRDVLAGAEGWTIDQEGSGPDPSIQDYPWQLVTNDAGLVDVDVVGVTVVAQEWNVQVQNSSAGDFTISDGVDTTDPIPWNVNNAALIAALQDIASIAGLVTIDPAGPAGIDVSGNVFIVLDTSLEDTITLTLDDSGLTGIDPSGNIGVTYPYAPGEDHTTYMVVVLPDGSLAVSPPIQTGATP